MSGPCLSFKAEKKNQKGGAPICGIAGWYVRNGVRWRPTQEMLGTMYKGIAARGKDATGYGTLQDDNSMYVYKGAVEVPDFLTFFKEQNCPIGQAGLLHTRAATIGDPETNSNNHPVSYEVPGGAAVMVVHNGQLGNLDEAYKALEIEQQAEVDSALIPAVLAIKGPVEGLEFLKEKSCGAAVIGALWDNGTLLLARDARPLYVAQVQEGAMVFASDKDSIADLSIHFDFGIGFKKIWEVPDSWFSVWSKTGALVASGQGFRLKAMYTPPKFASHGTGFTYSAPYNVHHQKMKTCEFCKESWWITHDCKTSSVMLSVNEAGVVITFPIIRKSSTNVMPELSVRVNDVPKGINVFCSWAHCGKRSLKTVLLAKPDPIAVPVPGQVKGAWYPLCQKHFNKWEAKPDKTVLSVNNEVIRKKEIA